MKTKLLSLLLFVVSVNFGFTQSKSIWSKVNQNEIENSTKVRRTSYPTNYSLWKLDIDYLKQILKNAPMRGENSVTSKVVIQIPNAQGLLESYTVLETQIMESELAQKFPNIKSYVGIGVENKSAVARFSVTEFGFHNMTLAADRSTSFIDPYTEDRLNYIVYDKASLVNSNPAFECLTKEGVHLPSIENDRRQINSFRADTNDKKLRTFRLAQSCTVEYGNLFDGADTDPLATRKARVQAQMAITMTRVNGVYENDLAITMIFVANNDLLIYVGAANSDPWNNEWNIKTGQVIDAAIGFNNYDIGHNFNTSGGGNAGCIGCVCGTDTNASGGNHKGTGYTGSSSPTGDPFDIDYVAHEMGHQYGGYHVQSSSNCRTGSGLTEVEPGSGSSIMGYAGICATNVQSNSDAYFAYVNIRDIMENVRNGISTCGTITILSNNPPTANAGRDYVIPKSTAFVLEGTGSDPENDPITYTWEENDPGDPSSAAAPTATRAVGPMFRSKWGTSSPERYLPQMSTILTGATSNTWEVCPSVARDLNFSLVVRDNNSGIGQTATDEMKVTVNGTAGPFVVTAPNTNVSWQAGTTQNVTWNVAGTTANNINCAYVDIYLSTNGGTSFPTLLASKVPNDGTESVVIPNTLGATNRIMVRGWNNIFLDVSNTNFTITAPASTMNIGFNGVKGNQNKSTCQGSSTIYPLNYTTYGGFSANTAFSVTGNPAGSTVIFSPASTSTAGTVNMTVTTTGATPVGFYNLVVTATSGAVIKTANFYLEIVSGNFVTQTLNTPVNNAVGQATITTLNWTSNPAATSYIVDVATDNTFNSIIYTATITGISTSVSGLNQNTFYYWRVKPINVGCEGVYSSVFNFKTGQSNCTYTYSNNNALAIPDNSTTNGVAGTTVTKTIVIPGTVTGNINDVDVLLAFTHGYVDDVYVGLVHPDGTEVALWNHSCENQFTNVNVTYSDGNPSLGADSCISGVGTFSPSSPLSVLIGKPAAGTWTLKANDYWSGDSGTVNGWTLNLCVAENLSSQNFNVIDDLILYPNPNNGNFEIKFNSISEKTNIYIVDTRGRLVFEKSFENKGIFSEVINFSNVEDGIYFVTVEDGVRKSTKKIVKE